MKTSIFSFLPKYFVTNILLLMAFFCLPLLAQVPPNLDDLNYIKGTFFGTATNDAYLLSVAVDGQGNVYGTGHCTSIPTTTGAYSRVNAGLRDIMVFKLNPTMTKLIWATYIGGAGDDGGGSLVVNAQGEVFVSGFTNSVNFPVTVNKDAATYLSTGKMSYFALKLSADGASLMYSRILGNSAPIQLQTEAASKGASIAINPQNEAFVFSHTVNTSPYTITLNAYQTGMVGTSDFVFTKLDATGNITYSTYIGGQQTETAGDICYANGKVFMTGATTSWNFPLNAGKTPDSGGDCVLIVADDGAVPNVRKSYCYGSSGADNGIAIAYDDAMKRVCVTGKVGSNDFPYTKVLLPGQTNGGFVAAIDETLSRIDYGVMVGAAVVPTSIVARRNGAVYIAGYSYGTTPLTPNAFQSVHRGSLDGVMLAIDSVGKNLRYGTYIGGIGNDYAVAKVLIFEQGCEMRVIFGITTHSPDYPTTSSAYQAQKLNGTEDQAALSMFAIPIIKEDLAESDIKPCAQFTLKHTPPPCRQPVEYIWIFGDGSPPVKMPSPATHTYERNGQYALTVLVVYPDADTIRLIRTVTVNSYPTIRAEPNTISLCAGEKSATLRATGGVRYRWSPADQVSDSTSATPKITPTGSGKYYVRGWDANGCEAIDSVMVSVVKIKALVEKDTIICEGQLVQLRASGATNVTWSPPDGLNKTTGALVIASPKKTTTYKTVVSDGVCSDSATVTVRVAHKPSIVMTPSPTICISGSAELRTSLSATDAIDTAGVVYRWTPNVNIVGATTPNPVVSPTATQWYKLSVSNKYGCVATDSVQVRVQNTISLDAVRDTGICLGSSVRLNVSGATTYTWSPTEGLDDAGKANPLCTPTRDMTYTVIGKSGLCADTIQLKVYIYPVQAAKGLGDTTVCQGERIRLWVEKPDPDMTYTWSPPDDFENSVGAEVYARPKRTTDYILQVMNKQGCVLYDTVHVSTDNALSVQASNDVSACEGENVVLRVSSSGNSQTTYTWTPNDGVYNPQTREYTVKVTANRVYKVVAQYGSCTGSDSVLVGVLPQPDFAISTDTSICTGTTLRLFASSTQPGIRYRWIRNNSLDAFVDDAQSSTPRTVALDKETIFTVEANLNGCIATKSMTVRVLQQPQILLPAEPQICPGESVQIQANVPSLRAIRWEPAEGLQSTTTSTVVASPQKTTTYTITATDVNGCSSTAQFTVKVKERGRVHFSTSNLGFMAIGVDTVITLFASADRVLTTSISADVVCNEGIFKPANDNASRVSNGKRYMPVRLSSVSLDQTPRPIARITGSTYLTSPTTSFITVENVELDTQQCLDTASVGGVIVINSCFVQGRNVRLIDLLSAVLMPNPADEEIVVNINTSEKSSVHLKLYDGLAREVEQWVFHHDGGDNRFTLPLKSIASGVYTLVIQAGWQQQSLPLVKQ